MTGKEIIKKYAKTNSKEQTIAHFHSGAGADQISAGLSLHLKAIANAWKEAQEEIETEEVAEPKEEVTPKAITLKMYADNGKAVWEYSGPADDGSLVVCKGEIKSREFAVSLAKRAQERSNQHKVGVDFQHGIREAQDEFLRENFSAICLSPEALEAVEVEIYKAYRPPMFGLQG